MTSGLDDKGKRMILHTHNLLRSIVASGSEIRGQPGPQPPAANMQLMVTYAKKDAIINGIQIQMTLSLLLRCGMRNLLLLHNAMQTNVNLNTIATSVAKSESIFLY